MVNDRVFEFLTNLPVKVAPLPLPPEERRAISAPTLFVFGTRDRLVGDLRVLSVTSKVAVDADPVHLASVEDLFLAHDGDVVLRVAGDDAGVAPRARRRIAAKTLSDGSDVRT